MFRVTPSMGLAFLRAVGQLLWDREFSRELQFAREALTLARLPEIRLVRLQAPARLTLFPRRALAISRASMRRQRGLLAYKTIKLDRSTPGELPALGTHLQLFKLPSRP